MVTDQVPLEERLATLAGLRDKYVRTDRDALFRSHLDRLLKRGADGTLLPEPVTFTATGETRGIALVEEAGGGKTSLVHHALNTHPAFQSGCPATVRWVRVEVPSPATLKSFGLEILRKTGYCHVSSRATQAYIFQTVRQRLASFGTAVLWIDEAHDLFRAGSHNDVEDILKLLKSLMQGEHAVIVVLTGVGTLWRMASYDDQVKRRYSKVNLPAVSATSQGPMFRQVLDKFCAELDLAPPVAPDLVERLVHASRYRFGRCFETILAALEIGVLEGAARLEIAHFAEAFSMQEGCAPGQNVFVTPNWAQIDLSAETVAAHEPAPTRKGRKKR
jgi:hypothetical protein